jgi:hypothetical protein
VSGTYYGFAVLAADSVITIDRIESMFFCDALKFLGTNPSPSLGVQPRTEGWSTEWADVANLLSPCVFSANCKREAASTEKCEARLAMNSNATIVMLIMIYLDTRSKQFEKLPAWMCVYALIYTELGFNIYVHYPSVHLTAGQGDGWHWRPTSCLLSGVFSNVFNQEDGDPDKRVRAIRVLFKLRSHSLFLVEQIRRWAETRGRYKKGSGIMDKLIENAYVQAGKMEWAIDQLTEAAHSEEQE